MCANCWMKRSRSTSRHIMQSQKIICLLCGWAVVSVSAQPDDPGKYLLKLNNSSPAALYSNVTFNAELYRQNGSLVDSKEYKYRWLDTVFFSAEQITYGDTSSNVSIRYEYLLIIPGEYTMTVKVFKKKDEQSKEWEDNEEKITEGEINFILTDFLNGKLTMSQNLNLTTPSRMFASKKDILFSASISDVFTNATLEYMWQVDAKPIANQSPAMNKTFHSTGKHTVGVTVIANIKKDGIFTIESVNKSVELNEFIEIKDSITGLGYSGYTTFSKGSYFNKNFTCSGTPPFYFLCNITSPSQQMESVVVEQDDCNFPVVAKLNETGTYVMYVQGRNDVGFKATTLSINVIAVTVASPWVPVACSIIGLFVLLLVGIVYHKDRIKSNETETADFDFHLYSDRASSILEQFRFLLRHRRWRSDEDRLEEIEQSITRERSNSYGSITSAALV